jgi:hypothetical protein
MAAQGYRVITGNLSLNREWFHASRSLLLMALSSIATPADSQWLRFRSPGIPRLPDGSPNLSAPAPRTPNDKPDLSGIWRSELVENGVSYHLNIARDLQPDDVRPWAEAIYQEHVRNLQKDAPWIRCLPTGLPLIETAAVTYRIVQTPSMIVMLYEETPSVPRQIFLDGREPPGDPNRSWLGYSVGHWEGEELVVETSGFTNRTWLDALGHPHSESLRLTERFRRKDLVIWSFV